MTEYITKEQAWEVVKIVARHGGVDSIINADKRLANMPAADVAPVVHARWVVTDEANICKPLSDVNVKARHYLEHDCECSNCGFICGIGVGQIKQANYCPFCGARMDGEEE